MFKKIIYFALLLLVVWAGCKKNSTEPPLLTPGSVSGIVRCGGNVVHSAYIFWGDSLLTTTDSQGAYHVDNVEPADYLLTASALFCGDTTLSVQVKSGSTTTLDFTLSPDSSIGRVYGEFQDDSLFQQRVLQDAGLASMTEKEICDGGTGATLQAKTLGYYIPDRTVSLGDSLLAYSDGYGQYWLKLPTGTYPLTGACEGYKSRTRVVTVPPNDGRVYLNFFLPRTDK